MSGVLLDTHAWVWVLFAPDRLSPAARTALETAFRVHVSPASVFEIARKVRVGKWPQMAPHVDALPGRIAADGAEIAPLTAEVALLAGRLDWPHRDPFDRLLAATALTFDMPILTLDRVFHQAAPKGLAAIW